MAPLTAQHSTPSTHGASAPGCGLFLPGGGDRITTTQLRTKVVAR